MRLVDSIAYELQKIMVTTQINTFLSGFGVKCTEDTVQSKRVYVQSLLSNQSKETVIEIATELDLYSPQVISSANLSNYLQEQGYQAAHDDFERAMNSIESDPEQAMGNASSILESICKSVLERLGKELPKDKTMKSLIKATYGAMNLSPDSHADADIKQVLGGIANAAIGIGVIRTKHSSFHGRTNEQKTYKLTKRHARLAVGCSSVLGCFLIETYLDRYEKKTS